ncbi:MAG: hypothetical protein ACOY5Y_02420 [Pseudomonadota bacterium]
MESPPPKPRKPTRRLPLLAVGALMALLAGVGLAWLLVSGERSSTPPPASEGGLVIDASELDNRIDPGKPLRCFVQGVYVGELTLTECATRNGVATDALDVGVDETGALAAAEQAGEVLTPLPPLDENVEPVGEPPSAFDEPQAAPSAGPAANCWRHRGGRWRKLGETDLNTCVQTLFAGRCERPGSATYGRFGQQTLRLVAGRVEISDDNRTFRTLVAQVPDCSLPPVG